MEAAHKSCRPAGKQATEIRTLHRNPAYGPIQQHVDRAPTCLTLAHHVIEACRVAVRGNDVGGHDLFSANGPGVRIDAELLAVEGGEIADIARHRETQEFIPQILLFGL